MKSAVWQSLSWWADCSGSVSASSVIWAELCFVFGIPSRPVCISLFVMACPEISSNSLRNFLYYNNTVTSRCPSRQDRWKLPDIVELPDRNFKIWSISIEFLSERLTATHFVKTDKLWPESCADKLRLWIYSTQNCVNKIVICKYFLLSYCLSFNRMQLELFWDFARTRFRRRSRSFTERSRGLITLFELLISFDSRWVLFSWLEITFLC
jgi:hypothetical protein